MSDSFVALLRLTMPLESSWKTRERIGGAAVITCVCTFLQINFWIHCKRISQRSSGRFIKYVMLSGSTPLKSRTSKASSS